MVTGWQQRLAELARVVGVVSVGGVGGVGGAGSEPGARDGSHRGTRSVCEGDIVTVDALFDALTSALARRTGLWPQQGRQHHHQGGHHHGHHGHHRHHQPKAGVGAAGGGGMEDGMEGAARPGLSLPLTTQAMPRLSGLLTEVRRPLRNP